MSPLDANAVEAEMQALKLREVAVLRQREALVRAHGVRFYRPHAKQDSFHRAGAYKSRAYFAGNRAGKSTVGVAEDVAQAMCERAWYGRLDPARTAGLTQRPKKILVIANDWDKVGEVFTNQRGADQGKFWQLLPADMVEATRTNHARVIDFIELKNGSTISFDTVESYKKNPLSAESSKWDVIHVDEPCPKPMFEAHARGLVDTDGIEYFTLTPLREPWIYDRFYGADADTRACVERQTAFEYKATAVTFPRWSITGSIWDNPHLTRDAILRYLESLDPDERECRESGIPLAFAGLVYKDFDPSLHVLREPPAGWISLSQPPRDYTIYYHIDPHPQTPTAVLFTAVAPSGRRYIFDEVFERDTVLGISARIRSVVDPYFVARARVDPLAYNVDELSGTCWADDFATNGIFLERAVKDLERGVAAGKAAWRARGLDGLPTWMVSASCTRFLYEIRRYAWSDKPNKPVDRDDHMMENFYRTVLDDPLFVPFNDSRPAVPDMEIVEGLTDADSGNPNPFEL